MMVVKAYSVKIDNEDHIAEKPGGSRLWELSISYADAARSLGSLGLFPSIGRLQTKTKSPG